MTVKVLQKAIHDQLPIEVYNKDSGEWMASEDIEKWLESEVDTE